VRLDGRRPRRQCCPLGENRCRRKSAIDPHCTLPFAIPILTQSPAAFLGVGSRFPLITTGRLHDASWQTAASEG
jgi:hypothetical protein